MIAECTQPVLCSILRGIRLSSSLHVLSHVTCFSDKNPSSNMICIRKGERSYFISRWELESWAVPWRCHPCAVRTVNNSRNSWERLNQKESLFCSESPQYICRREILFLPILRYVTMVVVGIKDGEQFLWCSLLDTVGDRWEWCSQCLLPGLCSGRSKQLKKCGRKLLNYFAFSTFSSFFTT